MIDLHVHTVASDGEHSVKEIIEMAQKNKIKSIAITDHDTVLSVKEAINVGNLYGIEVIPGIEISAEYVEDMHILGYYIDYNNKSLLQYSKMMQENRDLRNKKIIEQFNRMGIDLTYDEVCSFAKGSVIAKPHFAMALLAKKIITNYSEAFSKFFNLSEFNNIERKKLSPKDSIHLILNAGGIPVLAHPKGLKLDYESLEKKIQELKSYGLKGIECIYSYNTPEQTIKSFEIAQKNGLLITGGTDYHGETVNKDLKLGTGINNNIKIPDIILDRLKQTKKIMNEINT